MAKYCTKCGKKLEESEVCSCTQVQQQEVEIKNMFSEILLILKSPVNRVRQIAANNSPVPGIKYMIAKSILWLVWIVVAVLKMESELGVTIDYWKIPYLKLIFLTLLLTVGMDFLEALLLKVVTVMFRGKTCFNAMISVVGARTLYESLLLLVSAVLLLIYPLLGLEVFGFAALILPYIEYSAYRAVVRCEEDKKPYAFFVVKLCVRIITGRLLGLMLSDILASLAVKLGGLLALL